MRFNLYFLKLFLKSFIPLISILIFRLRRNNVQTNEWERRILIIFGGGIGDVVKRSVVCKFLKNYLQEYEVYYLLPYDLDLPYAHRIFYFDYTRAKTNPLYFSRLIKELSKVGFSKIAVLLPFWENFLWMLGLSLSPQILYIPHESAPSKYEKILNKIISIFFVFSVKKRIRLIKVISIFDREIPKNVFPSDVYKHVYFISQIIKEIKPYLNLNKVRILPLKKIETQIVVCTEKEQKFLERLEKEYNLKPQNYCIIGLGSSSSHKNWPIKNFVEVARYVKKNKNLDIVIVGGKESEKLVEKFEIMFNNHFINLVNKTNLRELCFLIKNCKLVLANDTSFIHIGIAFKKHTVCPILNTQLGADSLYGYKEINHWVYVKDKMDFHSIFRVTPEMVIKALEEIYYNTPGNFELFFANK